MVILKQKVTQQQRLSLEEYVGRRGITRCEVWWWWLWAIKCLPYWKCTPFSFNMRRISKFVVVGSHCLPIDPYIVSAEFQLLLSIFSDFCLACSQWAVLLQHSEKLWKINGSLDNSRDGGESIPGIWKCRRKAQCRKFKTFGQQHIYQYRVGDEFIPGTF